MTADIILFVPGMKPGETVREMYQVLSPEDAKKLVDRADTAPSEYTAPDGDCA